jgi:hypothetical protein
MRLRRLLCLLTIAGAAVLGATCAPEAPPPDGMPDRPAAGDDPVPNQVRDRVELALKNIRGRVLRADYGFWTVFHGILGLGPKTKLYDPEKRRLVNAIEYVSHGGKVPGMEFIPTPYGLDVLTASTPDTVFFSQGHPDQFIAEMAQWGMTPDHEFLVGGKPYHFRDFINNSKMRTALKPGFDGKRPELSWTILIAGQYLGTDATWKNKDGETIRLEDLLRYELDEPMSKAACGGTHRLFDLDWVYHLHLKRGGKTEGIWKRIADNAAHYRRLARQYQNNDGSFSTDFFNGRGDAPDPQLRINRTGHILEWLALSLTDEELRAPWVEEAVNALTLMILRVSHDQMEGATLYHAAHGLLLYHARVYDRAELGRDLSMVPLPPAGPAKVAAR